MITRRTILGYTATTLSIGLFGGVGCSRPDPALMVPHLLELAEDRAALAAIGRTYLEQAPRQRLEVIAQRLATDLDWKPGLVGQELGYRLAETVSSDYRTGKTRSVGYWILSDTEVHWTALVALSESADSADREATR